MTNCIDCHQQECICEQGPVEIQNIDNQSPQDLLFEAIETEKEYYSSGGNDHSLKCIIVQLYEKALQGLQESNHNYWKPICYLRLGIFLPLKQYLESSIESFRILISNHTSTVPFEYYFGLAKALIEFYKLQVQEDAPESSHSKSKRIDLQEIQSNLEHGFQVLKSLVANQTLSQSVLQSHIIDKCQDLYIVLELDKKMEIPTWEDSVVLTVIDFACQELKSLNLQDLVLYRQYCFLSAETRQDKLLANDLITRISGSILVKEGTDTTLTEDQDRSEDYMILCQSYLLKSLLEESEQESLDCFESALKTAMDGHTKYPSHIGLESLIDSMKEEEMAFE